MLFRLRQFFCNIAAFEGNFGTLVGCQAKCVSIGQFGIKALNLFGKFCRQGFEFIDLFLQRCKFLAPFCRHTALFDLG